MQIIINLHNIALKLALAKYKEVKLVGSQCCEIIMQKIYLLSKRTILGLREEFYA
jgi:hypothetical protein